MVADVGTKQEVKMADINILTITGRLTADAEYKTVASGKGLLVANVACNTGFGDYQKTTYIKIQWWGDAGKNVCQYLQKGNLIATSGEVELNVWTDRQGKEHSDLVLNVRGGIQMLCKSKANQEVDNKKPEEDIDIVF